MKRLAFFSAVQRPACVMASALFLVVACGDESSSGGDGGTNEAAPGNSDAAVQTSTDAGIDTAEPSDDAGESDAGAIGSGGDDSGTGDDSGSGPDDDTSPLAGNLELAVVSGPAQASAVSTIVGVYTGNLGIWAPVDGHPARYTDNCTITVAADGTLTVRASDNEVSAVLNGNELDVVTSPNRDELSRAASAFERVGNDENSVTVTVLRGYLTSAIANVRTLQNQAVSTVTCYVRNPNPRNVRTGMGTQGTALTYGGATAADLNSAWIGSYGNGSCTASIAADGTIHLTKGSVDLSARMAGDAESEWGDTLAVFPSSIELRAGELLVDGTSHSVRMQKNGANWEGFARSGADVLVSFNECKDLVKQ